MPRRIILVTLIPLAIAGVGTAAGQDEVVSDLLDCDRFSEPQRRLACFDALVDKYGSRARPFEETAQEPAAPESEREVVEQAPKSPAETGAPGKAASEAQAAPAPATTGRTAESVPEQPSRPERIESPEDFSLPHETRITAFRSNRNGDYRFRITEGFVFERTGGPAIPMDDLTGSKITLSKNFLGQWRAEVEGRGRELSIRHVRDR